MRIRSDPWSFWKGLLTCLFLTPADVCSRASWRSWPVLCIFFTNLEILPAMQSFLPHYFVFWAFDWSFKFSLHPKSFGVETKLKLELSWVELSWSLELARNLIGWILSPVSKYGRFAYGGWQEKKAKSGQMSSEATERASAKQELNKMAKDLKVSLFTLCFHVRQTSAHCQDQVQGFSWSDVLFLYKYVKVFSANATVVLR